MSCRCDAPARLRPAVLAPYGAPAADEALAADVAAGLVAYPDNWRAAVRRPATLPHYPMVLYRGGYPDGS